eukprot:11611715-Alexandrium_andersonii.AAC.1
MQGALCAARSLIESSLLNASLRVALHHGPRSGARGVAGTTECPSCSVSTTEGLRRASAQRPMLAKQVEG